MSDIDIQQAGRHSVYVQRFAGSLANEFNPYMDQLIREIRFAINEMDDQQDLRAINTLIEDYKKLASVIYKDYNDTVMLPELREFAGYESDFAIRSMESASDEEIPLVSLPLQLLWTTVMSIPLIFATSLKVKTLRPFIRDWEQGQINKVGDIIRTGLITGLSQKEIIKQLTGKNGYMPNQGMKSIKSMIRTATNHVSNQSRLTTFRENQEALNGYQLVAVLDNRTSNICKGYDGLIVRPKDKQQPYPPFHPNCRTTTAPVRKRKFGGDDEGRRANGASGSGFVDADITYYDWLKQQGGQGPKGRDFVMDVLGNERGKLFMDGGLTVDKFKQLTLDDLFQPIPLVELRDKNSLQLAFDAI